MQTFVHEVVPLAVTCENGDFVIHYFITKGRGTFLPSGAQWVTSTMWERLPTEENIKDNLYNSFLDRPVVSWRRISPNDVPEDREFRNAWMDNGQTITHDMEKAKEIKRTHIRHERARAMVELDAQYMKALGQGKDTSAVEKKRQEWRDAPADPRITQAKTIDDLKAISLPK